MEYEDFKAKSQKVSSLLERANCPEDILNCKEIALESDFQYICMNCNANMPVVVSTIARLAQDGNKQIIMDNIRNISIGLWNEVFCKNNFTKEIFNQNFSTIIENAGIVTYRDIESFLDDGDTRKTIVSNIDFIIKKLCTYDRASLIENLSKTDDGITAIKNNLENFFQKGEYDISTTYSKIVAELSNVPGLSKQSILEASSKHLTEMIERETAVDNETNALLIWIYDAMEDCKMGEEERAALQSKIDDAILANFDNILDKTNYDRETIKILKLFTCTHGKFTNNKNMFIENSNKLIHMTKIYDLNYEKESKIDKEGEEPQEDNNQQEEQSAEVKVENIAQDVDNEYEKCLREELDTIRAYEALLKENDKETNTEDFIQALVRSNITEADAIVDRIVNRDDTKVWDKCNIDKIENDDKAITKKYDFRSMSKTAFDYGKKDVVEYAKKFDSEQDISNKKESVAVPEENYNFSRNVKDEEALIIEDTEMRPFKRAIKVVRGFFRKIKLVLRKYKSERFE